MKYLISDFFKTQEGTFFFVASESGVLKEVNNTWITQLGWSIEEVIGKNIAEFIQSSENSSSDVKINNRNIFNFFSNKRIPFISKDEKKIWIHWNINFDINNRLFFATGIVCTEFVDIKNSFQRFVDNVDSIAIVSITDFKGIITKVNNNFCKISGYSEVELLGSDHRIVNSSYHSKEFFSNLWKTITSGQMWEGEVCNRNKDDSIYWVHSKIIPIKDPNLSDQIIGFMSVRYDITKRKMFEKTLRQSTIWLETLINSSHLLIISTDTDGVITTFNKIAENFLGYKAEEVITKTSPAIFHDFEEVVNRSKELSMELGVKIDPGFETFVAKAKRIGPDTNEWTYIRKDGSRFPIKLCVTPLINSTGETIGYLGVAEDITEMKKMFHTIEAQRLQIINSAKMSSLGEMASGIAHEINNPLSIIQANSTLLIERLNSGEVPRDAIINCLEKINNTGDRINKIIKGLRTISRNADSDNYEIFSIQKIIEDVVNLSEQKLKKGEIKVIINIPNQPIMISCSPTQISQVLINLINNSCDAIINRNNKWISLDVKLINDSKTVECSVTDCADGIPKEIANKLMQPFFTTKEVGKGTGIGLSISRGIIEKHSGKFYLDEKCVNTRFVFEIPVSTN